MDGTAMSEGIGAVGVLDNVVEQLAEKLAVQLAEQPLRRYLTVRQAADYSSICEDSIRSMIAAGRLTALRPVPGRIVIDRLQLDAVIQASTNQPRRGRGRPRKVQQSA
jgi:excisionase family DNA binding protein